MKSIVLCILILLESAAAYYDSNGTINTVKCKGKLFRIESASPYIVVTLTNAMVQIFDTVGNEVYYLDFNLKVPDMSKFPNSQSKKMVVLDDKYDFVKFFPRLNRAVVFRDRYTYSDSFPWEILKNGIKHTFGFGSRVEVWDCNSRKKIYEKKVLGSAIPRTIDLSPDYLAFVVLAANRQNPFIVNLNTYESYSGDKIDDANVVRILHDTLYVLGHDNFYIFCLDQTSDLSQRIEVKINCNIYQFFLLDYESNFTSMNVAYNECFDSTFGPLSFVGDSLMFAKSKEIINFSVIQLEEFRWPIGVITRTDEIILPSFSDTLYFVNFDKRTIRQTLISNIIDTSKYFLPYPIQSDFYYTRVKGNTPFDSNFALLKALL